MGTAHLLRTLLPHDSVELGRLVKNANRPHQDYIDPLHPRPNPLKNTQPTTLTSPKHASSNTSTATLTAPKTTTYDLSNSDAWFKDACKQEKTRRWLEEAIDKSQNVYLIVGFRIAQNASLASSINGKKDSRVGGEVPVRAFAPSTGLNPLIVNPGGRDTQSRASATDLAFDALGEQVFAVLYRKIKFSWLSSRKAANMKLEEGNRWKSVWDWRGPGGDIQDDEDDVLEAELTDSSDLEDDEEFDSEDEDNDDGFRNIDIALAPTLASATVGTGSSGQQGSGVVHLNEASGGVEEVKALEKHLGEKHLGEKHSGLGVSRMVILPGVMLLLLLLLSQWFFELGPVITRAFAKP